MNNSGPVRVGVVGLGRSGWGIHIDAIRRMPDQYHVVAVHDALPGRLGETAAAVGARGHATLEALLADAEVELVVVATANKFHFPHALAALRAGKHVLCEKPFCLRVAEVDQLIDAAKQAGVILQPFQQRRYEADFRKVKEICDSGLLGQIQFIRTCWHGFKRRWDWQTIPEMGAGELFNNGPHPIDHALSLMRVDEDPVEADVWCERRHCLCSGDAEDHIKVILTAPQRPTVEIEVSNVFAFGQDRWLVCGTSGGLRGGANRLEWKWVDWSQMPPRPLDPNPTPDRSYNSEKLAWQSGSWNAEGAADAGAGAAPASAPVLALYGDLYASIREGRPQVITPQSVRRRVAVLEKAAAVGPVRR